MIPSLLGKKKTIAMILGMHGEKDTEEGEENPLHVIAKELLEGIKADDVLKVSEALKAAWASMEAEEFEAGEG